MSIKRGKTAAVILAAGRAERAGGPKIIWPVRGRPSVRLVAEAALAAPGVDLVLAVTGAFQEEVTEALAGLPVALVHNPLFAGGQASSLKAALPAVPPEFQALMFLLADQPLVSSRIIGAVIECFWNRRAAGATLAAPFFQGRRRNPALFYLPRWRDALLALAGDRGGREILDENPAELALWPCQGPAAAFADFDTLDAYHQIINGTSA